MTEKTVELQVEKPNPAEAPVAFCYEKCTKDTESTQMNDEHVYFKVGSQNGIISNLDEPKGLEIEVKNAVDEQVSKFFAGKGTQRFGF